MKIINVTRNTVLADNAIVAKTLLSRIIGLLNRKSLNQGEALVITHCSSIHTIFMRFSIDVLFVDKENKVIKAISNLKPFRLTYIYPRSSYVIELPTGTIESTHTQETDELKRF